MNELALFAGGGGGILAGHLLGWRTVCAVEIEDYPRRVLLQRQADGFLPRFPIWDDICTFDGKPWAGKVDVISGGFPCQDISAAGKGAGLDGERSGLWGEMARVIHEVQPRFVFVENSPMLTSRGLGTVLGDLATMGFDARWGVLGASDVGAKHERKRIWIVARQPKFLSHAQHNRIRWWEQQQKSIEEKAFNMANTNDSNWRREHRRFWSVQKCNQEWDSHSTFNKPEPIRMVDGVANRVDRLKAIGNGQVPLCAATAWRILSETL
jgi:DNA (cytosine-5)-methyltransferase 1